MLITHNLLNLSQHFSRNLISESLRLSCSIRAAKITQLTENGAEETGRAVEAEAAAARR